MKMLSVALPILAVIVALLLRAEVRRFKAGRHLISPRRLGLRLVAGALMIALLAAVFVGLFVLGLREAGSRADLFLLYWSGCLLVGVALIFVMLADLREVEASYMERRSKMRREYAESLARSVHGRREGEPDSEDEGDE